MELFELDLDITIFKKKIWNDHSKDKALSYGAIVSCTWKGSNMCLLEWWGRFNVVFFGGVLDHDIIYCDQFLSYHLIKYQFEISILYTPFIFKHAMPFFNKGEWPFLSSLLMQSSSTWMWRIQIGLVGLQCAKQHVSFTLLIWKPLPLEILSWVGRDICVIAMFESQVDVLGCFFLSFMNVNNPSFFIWWLIYQYDCNMYSPLNTYQINGVWNWIHAWSKRMQLKILKNLIGIYGVFLTTLLSLLSKTIVSVVANNSYKRNNVKILETQNNNGVFRFSKLKVVDCCKFLKCAMLGRFNKHGVHGACAFGTSGWGWKFLTK